MGESNIRVLIGSGEATVREGLRLSLSREGVTITVAEATSFEAFVREAITGSFDVVILFGNTLLPPFLCDGGIVENVRCAIKTIRTASPVTIVAISSMPDPHNDLIASGANFVLTTPVKAAQLQDAVFDCLQRRA